MLELQKIFLLVRLFNRISCNKGLKAKFSCFLLVFFCLTPLRLECSRRSWKTASWFLTTHIGWRNTKICIHGASRMERRRGKCWKSPIFEGKLQAFISYLSEMKIVCSITLLYSSTFYSLFLPFFVLEIFKFNYDKVFIRHSASISKFKWFELPCPTLFKARPKSTKCEETFLLMLPYQCVHSVYHLI